MQIKTLKIQDLIEYARNPRKNDAVVDRMVSCIKEFGFRIPIVAKSDGSVVDGHLRLKAARKLGLEEVPVVIADDLSDTQIKAFRLIANQSANWAEWNDELLKLELEDLKGMSFDLDLTGFDLSEIESMLHESNAIEEDFEDEETADENEKVISKFGDLWILDNHKLLCGNATKSDDFLKLLDSETAAMTFTDPPYNVDYGTNQRDSIRNNKRAIESDNIGNFCEFLQHTCSNIINYTSGAMYIFMSGLELDNLKRAFEEAGGHWSTFIVWAKNHFAVGKSDYQRQYEFMLYGWKKNCDHYWCGDRTQSDIWNFDRVPVNKLHPTMKPIALVKQAISNSSRTGDIVLDPFCGSGTTIIACEQLNRRACCIELDPKYIDVIIRRWQKFTGKQAILESTGQTFDEVASCR